MLSRYVGEVDKRELNEAKSQFNKDNGFQARDIIGRAGIERTYNNILMGRDGERRSWSIAGAASSGKIDRTSRFRDVPSTRDRSGDQKLAEAQTDSMPPGRGVIGVQRPNNGEILALVSHPASESKCLLQRAKTDQGRMRFRELYEDPDKPLYNRVIQGQIRRARRGSR